jgi:glycosyltransferase involved in cell wall biosynthesis
MSSTTTTTTTAPFISILMITYNHEQYIAQALESILMQQGDIAYEIVIGEDCSTDNTRAIVQEFQQRYPHIIRPLLHPRNIGMMQNFMRTYEACRGRYIAMLEGDDYWTSPYKLQRQADVLDAHPDIAICFHTVQRFTEDGSSPPDLFPDPHYQTISTIEDILQRNFIQSCSAMFRNRLFGNFPPWFGSLKLGDWPLHILNAQYGNISYISEVLAAYRMHGSGVWSANPELWMPASIAMLEKMRTHLHPRYRPLLQKILYSHYSQMITRYEAQHNLSGFTRYVLKSLRTHPTPKQRKRMLRGTLQLYTPLLAQPVHKMKHFFLSR